MPGTAPQGYIYVEAAKESHVKDAVRGLRTVFHGKPIRLVPINEMVDAVTVNKKAKDAIGEGAHGHRLLAHSAPAQSICSRPLRELQVEGWQGPLRLWPCWKPCDRHACCSQHLCDAHGAYGMVWCGTMPLHGDVCDVV